MIGAVAAFIQILNSTLSSASSSHGKFELPYDPHRPYYTEKDEYNGLITAGGDLWSVEHYFKEKSNDIVVEVSKHNCHTNFLNSTTVKYIHLPENPTWWQKRAAKRMLRSGDYSGIKIGQKK